MSNLYRCENTLSLEKIKDKQYEKRGRKSSSKSKKKKLNFKTCKNNTINSLNEVEHFLRNFNGIVKYIKLYKILK